MELLTVDHQKGILQDYILQYESQIYRARIEQKIASDMDEQEAATAAASVIARYEQALKTVKAELALLGE